MGRQAVIRVALLALGVTLGFAVLGNPLFGWRPGLLELLGLYCGVAIIAGVFLWAFAKAEPLPVAGPDRGVDETPNRVARPEPPVSSNRMPAPPPLDRAIQGKPAGIAAEMQARRSAEAPPVAAKRAPEVHEPVALVECRPDALADLDLEWKVAPESRGRGEAIPPRLSVASVLPPLPSKVERPGRERRVGTHWQGLGDTVTVHGFVLANPLVYLSDGAPEPEEASCLDLRLRVGRPLEEPRGALGYYPSYAAITPNQRANYLTWLARNRTGPLDDIGYAFLFFYGLERRVLIDQADLSPVVKEVVRLLQLYTFSGSFDGYLSRFLAFCLARAGIATLKDKWFKAVFEQSRLRRDEDFLSVALAWFHDRGAPLPADWAMRLCRQDPRCARSVVIDRMPEQFEALFARTYGNAFGDGVQLRAAKRGRRLEYRAASPSLGHAWSGPTIAPVTLSDVLGIQSQFKGLADLWNRCIEELKPASRAVGKGLSITTREAFEALPVALRAEADHPDKERWDALVSDHTAEDGYALVGVAKLAPLHGLGSVTKLTVKQSQALATTAEQVGLVIEPDARLTRRSYGWEDVVALLRPEEGQSIAVDSRYLAASLMLELGLYVAAADGNIEESEVGQIAHFLEAQFRLEPADTRRLEALRRVFTAKPPSIAGLGKRLQETLTAEQRSGLCRFLTGIAAANGIIDRKEVAALRSAYRALQIPVEELDSLLKEFRRASQEPVELGGGVAQAGAGGPLPRRGPADGTEDLALDLGLLRRIMDETQQVATMLGEAMMQHNGFQPEGAVEEAIEASKPETSKPDPRFPELAGRFHGLLAELLGKSSWAPEELAALASRHPQARIGYIEWINDWSMERTGEPLLIEGDEGLLVQVNLIDEQQ
jgi:uncharacterized tellurite resistance protein B-like protein